MTTPTDLPITDSKGLTPELSAALQRGADGVYELLKDWDLINFDAKANKRLWQIGRNLEGIFGCSLRGDYTAALRARGAVPSDFECRAAWAKRASKYHGWPSDATPTMRDGQFECSWHETEYQLFLDGVRYGCA